MPWFPVFLLFDCLFDQIIGRLYFREVRHFWLFTSRCQWHIDNSKGRKLMKAHYACKWLLDPYENGGHC